MTSSVLLDLMNGRRQEEGGNLTRDPDSCRMITIVVGLCPRAVSMSEVASALLDSQTLLTVNLDPCGLVC